MSERNAEPASLAAVLPTLNERETIGLAISSLRAAGVDEIVVVDGGSGDGTVERAAALADRLVESGGGLFAQLNAGAAATSASVLVFHYADGVFPLSGRQAIARALTDTDCVGGAFTLALASPRSRYRLVAWGAGVRNRLGFGPFGDQSIFVRRDAFEAVGAYRPTRFHADLDLVRRLRSAGRFALLTERVSSSVRRWERLGFARTLINHWWLTALYLGGKRRLGQAARERAVALRSTR